MAERDPATVFVAESGKLADVVLDLLAGKGITAEAVSTGAKTESEPVTGMTEVTGPTEFEIRVADPKKAEEARELLSSAENTARLLAVREKRAARTGTVSAVCDECGQSSDWPAARMGATENCPHCGAYMDIPDPDDDWADVDFGNPDEDDDSGERSV